MADPTETLMQRRLPAYTPAQLRDLWLRFLELGARTGRRDPDDPPPPAPGKRPDPTPHNARLAMLRGDLIWLSDWLKRHAGDPDAWKAFQAVFLDLRLAGETMAYRIQFVLDDWHEDGIAITPWQLERMVSRALHHMAWRSGWRPPRGYIPHWSGWVPPDGGILE